MSNVQFVGQVMNSPNPNGDLYLDTDDCAVYVVACAGEDTYVLASLGTGNRYFENHSADVLKAKIARYPCLVPLDPCKITVEKI